MAESKRKLPSKQEFEFDKKIDEAATEIALEFALALEEAGALKNKETFEEYRRQALTEIRDERKRKIN